MIKDTYVWVVHENIPYESGAVLGIFCSEKSAIAYAQTLRDNEVVVSRWIPADDIRSQKEVEVWKNSPAP